MLAEEKTEEHSRIIGDSAAARAIRQKDWTASPLGPIARWPEPLLNFVNLTLASPMPMQVLWGPELFTFHNDAMSPFLAGKGPGLQGEPCRIVWREAWDAVGAQLEGVLATGDPVSFKAVFLPLEQNGVLEDMYWDYSYLALHDSSGSVAGILNISQNVTDAVLAQKELRASEAQANRVLSSIGDAVIVTDAAGLVVRMNPIAEALTGWAMPAATGVPLRSVFHIVNETTREVVESPADKVFRTGSVVGLANHTVLLAKDGRETSIDDSGAPIRNDDGELTGVVLVFRNIDDRRRSERERAMLDERLGLALSAANGVGIWDWDIARDRVYTDANFARMYGVDEKEAVGGISIAAFTANMHRDDVERVGREIDQAIQTGGGFASEYRLLQRNGEVRWVFAKGRCSYGPDGKANRFPGVTIDVTERKAMESALRSGEERLRIAVETAHLGTWEVDLLTGSMVCSELCKANYGRTADETFDYPDLLACIHPEDRPVMKAAVDEAIANGTPYRCEYRILWPDETQHWVIASGRVTCGEHGEPLRITGVSLDVTERHLTYAALMQTEKLAAVGRLAASIAHEINNPLESVTNLLYLARTNTDITEIQGHLDIAERELRRVSVITNQTLRFHRQSTKPKAVTFDDLFESVLSIYQGRLVNTNVRVQKRNRSTQPVLCFDGEIRQVLNNLVGNAIDAMQATGGRLLLRGRDATEWSTDARGMLLTIADTGSGISDASLRKIFEPFYTTKGIGGTGLGLWVSEEIVERHKGKLDVRSSQREGQSGTVFTLFLPFDAAAR